MRKDINKNNYDRDKAQGTATIWCTICFESYQMNVSNLTEPIDVYAEWLDLCNELNAEPPKKKVAV